MPITGSQPAKMFAQVGVARVGATRVGYASGLVFIRVGGTYPCVLEGSLTITDELDETPNRAMFTLKNTVTTQGQDIVITLGSKSATRLFAGHVLSSTQQHRAAFPDLLLSAINAVDYTWQLGFQKVTAKYQQQSAADIVRDLIATYAAVNGFTTNAVSTALPVVDEITFTNEDLTDALTRLVRRIGAYWYVDYYKDVHVFFEETGNGAPVDLTPAHRSLSSLNFDRDRTQALSRVYVEGRGTRLLSSVNAGDTRLPVEAVDMFLVAPDVFLKVSYQGSDGGAKHLDFTGVVAGGGGSIVGPGIGPTDAPIAAAVAGTGVNSGTHFYAVTFTTAAGESLTGPVAPVSVGVLPTAPVLSVVSGGSTSGIFYGAWQAKITFLAADGTESLASAASNVATTVSPDLRTLHLVIPLGPAGTVKRRIYFKEPGAGSYRAWTTFWDIQNNTVTECEFSAQMNGPLINEPTGASRNQVNLSAIPVGNTSVTGRKVYRTVAGGGPLKLLTTIANNTATTYVDTTADASLGAEPPAGGDTSGLKQPEGQVNPGSDTIRVAGTAAFQANGGWAIIGNGDQVIRYTAAGSNFLTGIPFSGDGSITAVVVYNSTITAAPMLTGIPATGPRSVTRPLVSGDEIYLVVQSDNTGVRDVLAQMGGNGVREEWVQDRRLSIPEARARGLATLQLRPNDDLRCTYVCRDTRTASGKTIVLNLPDPPFSLVTSLKIQAVTISNFRSRPNQQPTYTVQASSQRHTFDDLLRRARYKE